MFLVIYIYGTHFLLHAQHNQKEMQSKLDCKGVSTYGVLIKIVIRRLWRESNMKD